MFRLWRRCFSAHTLKELAGKDAQSAVKYFASLSYEQKTKSFNAFPTFAETLLKNRNSTIFLQELIGIAESLNRKVKLFTEAEDTLEDFGNEAFRNLNLDNLDIYMYFAWNSFEDRPFPYEALTDFLIRPIPSSDEVVIKKWVKLANDVMFYAIPEIDHKTIDEFVTIFGGYSRSLATLVKIAATTIDNPSDAEEEVSTVFDMSIMLDLLKPTYEDYKLAADYIVHVKENEPNLAINDDALQKVVEFAYEFKDFEFISFIFNSGTTLTQSGCLQLESYAYMMQYLVDNLQSGWVDAVEKIYVKFFETCKTYKVLKGSNFKRLTDVRVANNAFIKAYLKEGRIAEAAEYLLAIKLNEKPVDPEVTVELANKALELRDWEMMSKLLQSAYDTDYIVKLHKLSNELQRQIGGNDFPDYEFPEEWKPTGIKVFDMGEPEYEVYNEHFEIVKEEKHESRRRIPAEESDLEELDPAATGEVLSSSESSEDSEGGEKRQPETNKAETAQESEGEK
mmetsp:Transcript_33021/g.58136  ORF Transcript_33021/g.58136 Transcript_33021/m.58136 type:complete len:508 (-) Transcript_33021:55-1578(-)